jgi:hypothetical protein
VYLRHYSGALGFTPDEEKSLLAQEKAEGAKLDEMLEILRKQQQLRNIIAAGAVVGLIFTLTRFGDLIAEIRRRRRES